MDLATISKQLKDIKAQNTVAVSILCQMARMLIVVAGLIVPASNQIASEMLGKSITALRGLLDQVK